MAFVKLFELALFWIPEKEVSVVYVELWFAEPLRQLIFSTSRERNKTTIKRELKESGTEFIHVRHIRSVPFGYYINLLIYSSLMSNDP